MMEGLSVREESLSELDCLTGEEKPWGGGRGNLIPVCKYTLMGKTKEGDVGVSGAQRKVKGHTSKYRKFN